VDIFRDVWRVLEGELGTFQVPDLQPARVVQRRWNASGWRPEGAGAARRGRGRAARGASGSAYGTSSALQLKVRGVVWLLWSPVPLQCRLLRLITSLPSLLPSHLHLLHPRKRRNTERGPEAGVRGVYPGVWVRRTGRACARIQRGSIAYTEGGLSPIAIFKGMDPRR